MLGVGKAQQALGGTEVRRPGHDLRIGPVVTRRALRWVRQDALGSPRNDALVASLAIRKELGMTIVREGILPLHLPSEEREPEHDCHRE